MGALKDIGTYEEISKTSTTRRYRYFKYSKYASKAPTIQRDVYQYVLDEVKNGTIEIDSKVLKILRIKIDYEILTNQFLDL